MRRLAVVAALALAAACGSGDDSGVRSSATSVPATAPAADLPASTDGGPAPAAADGGVASPPTSATTGAVPAPPSPEAGPPLDGRVDVGAFAPALLRPDQSSRLVVEVHADLAPAAATLTHVRSVLAEVSGKPVEVVEAGGPNAGSRSWTAADLRDAADAGARVAQGAGTAVIRLLFVAGSFEGDGGVLGVAVRGDVAAVFVDEVDDAAGVLGSAEAIEAAVTTHEVGHLLGLVDLHLDTGRADPEHPGHSPNRASVMYWAVESDLIGQLLGADPPRDFDEADRADLARIRGG